jgi:transcriptional regulator with XRE-family HTH domain
MSANQAFRATRGVVEWFGPGVRAEREAQGLTQSELAARCGVRVATISDIEGGKASPSLAVALRVLSALGCGLDVQAERVRYLA